MRKILLIRSKVNKGGPGALITAICRELKKRDYEIVVVAGGGDQLNEIRDMGIKTYIFSNLLVDRRRWLENIRDVFRLKNILINEKIEIIYGFNPGSAILAYVADKIGRYHCKIVCAVIGPGKEWFQRIVPFKLIAMSDTQKEDMIMHGIKEKKIVVNYPSTLEKEKFDYETCLNTLRIELGLSRDTIIIGSVMMGHKGTRYLAELIKPILNRFLSVHYVLVGDTSSFEKCKNDLEGEEISKRVHYLGVRKDIPMLMKAFDIYSHILDKSSSMETFGMVITEAMIMKTPVIATNEGGIKDIVENEKTGFLVELDEEYIEKATQLIEDEGLRKLMAENGYKKVCEKFTLEKTVDQFEAIIKSL